MSSLCNVFYPRAICYRLSGL